MSLQGVMNWVMILQDSNGMKLQAKGQGEDASSASHSWEEDTGHTVRNVKESRANDSRMWFEFNLRVPREGERKNLVLWLPLRESQ